MIKVLSRSSMILKKLEFQLEDNVQDELTEEYADMIGKYPYLQIGNTTIQTDDTIKITIFNNQFLPKIEVMFKDPTNRLIDVLFPTDNDILSLFIQSSSEVLMPVRMDFKILDFKVIKDKDGDNNEKKLFISGILNVDKLYQNKFLSYQDSSFNTLKQIANETSLGFASNISDTNDTMTWINPSDTYLDFIQNIVTRSYSSDSTFMYSYVDFYYNLNYVDIETALNEDITGQTGIFFSANLIKGEKEEPTMDMKLTDHPDKSTSNQYINKFILNNSSTRVNLNIGYKSHVSYYDKIGKKHVKLILDTISTAGKGGDNVVLKGSTDETTSLVDLSYDTVSMGKYDSDNVHENYLYSFQQNSKNLDFLQKVKIKVSLTIMNFNLYRFQKIKIDFYKLDEMYDDVEPVDLKPDNVEKMAGSDFDEKRKNKRLSGEWLITAINYTFNKVGGFTQDVTLVRRELGFNDEDYV